MTSADLAKDLYRNWRKSWEIVPYVGKYIGKIGCCCPSFDGSMFLFGCGGMRSPAPNTNKLACFWTRCFDLQMLACHMYRNAETSSMYAVDASPS